MLPFFTGFLTGFGFCIGFFFVATYFAFGAGTGRIGVFPRTIGAPGTFHLRALCDSCTGNLHFSAIGSFLCLVSEILEEIGLGRISSGSVRRPLTA